MERAESVLPRYRSVFEKACTIKNEISSNEITWQFLAAIAYQESHWIPDARSFTGVRGMMMLTRDTARAMGVSDRVNPTQSIRGGARYMQWILDSLPEQIHDRSRLPMALASYNMGPGYVLAARKITSRQGGDPNSWLDVKKRLRIFGQNRSAQAESFVRRTLRYYQLLNWMTSQEESLETS